MYRQILFLMLTFLISDVAAAGQTLDVDLTELFSKVQTIRTKKKEYKQELTIDSKTPNIITINTIEVTKGDEWNQTVNLLDLNPNLVKFEPDKEYVEISAKVNKGKKLVRYISDGELDNYEDELIFYASGIEDARTLSEALEKAIIEFHEKADVNKGNPENINGLQLAITQLVKNVVINEDQYTQELVFDNTNPFIFTYEINDVSKGDVSNYKLNSVDLNVHKTEFYTKGNEVFLNTVTLGDKKVIRAMENGELENYENELFIRTNTVEDARLLTRYIEQLINLAEKNKVNRFEKLSYKESLDFIRENIGEVVINQDAYEQEIDIKVDNDLLYEYKITDVSDADIYEYTFNVADLYKGETVYDTKGEEVYVYLKTAGEQDLIKQEENYENVKYIDEMEIRASDVENARDIAAAFTRLKSLGFEKMESKTGFSTVNEAEAYLLKNVVELVIEMDAFEQSIEQESSDKCIYTYHLTDVTKDKQYDYKWNFKDIDQPKTHFSTKGAEVLVNLETKGGNKLIQVFEDGEADNFDDEVSIFAENIEQARKLVSALKIITENCQQ